MIFFLFGESLLAQEPHGLMVESIRSPENILIKDTKPEYSWIVPKSIHTQSGYQILVASSNEKINDNIGDIWDSGEVMKNSSSEISHQGLPLVPGNRYYWKVRILDAENKLSKYSNSQSFKIGKTTPGITTANSLQLDSIRPASFKQKNVNSYFIDFGKSAFANLEFRYDTKTVDTITVRIGEQLKDGQINQDPQGTIRYQEVKVAVTPQKKLYQLPLVVDKRHKKDQAVKLPPFIPVLMPFRYVELQNVNQTISENNFTQLAYHSYWEDDQSDFESSNDILNQVWDLCKYSIKATSFAGLYVDGDRERIPYEADAYLNQLSHYYTDREYPMARQTIEYFMDHPTWPTEWQLHVALMFFADYMHTGNTELIEQYYDAIIDKTLIELAREDGLISSAKATPAFMKKLGFKPDDKKLQDIVDWPPAQKDTGWELATEEGERDGFVFMPINTVVNCFFFRNMEIMAHFAKVLNKPEDELHFNRMALKVKNSINEKLFDSNIGAYIDGEGTTHASLHSNMMALAFNMVPEEHIKSVTDFIKSRGMACSVYGAQYLLEGLYNAGEGDYALELMTATHDRSWYNMIEVGSTITMEAWDMKYKPNSDWNHAWGAVPANMIPQGLWGIQAQIAGYEKAIIKPQMGTLKNSSITVPTIKGLIKGTYKQLSNELQQYTIELPGNMEATFSIDTSSNSVIKLNGKKINKFDGSIRLSSGLNTIELRN